MLTAEHVQQRIQAAFPSDEVKVADYTGTGDHFRAEVVSGKFAELSRVQQHKLVYAAVKEELADGSIHALSISTTTPKDAS
jgi:stress-induced morphogen